MRALAIFSGANPPAGRDGAARRFLPSPAPCHGSPVRVASFPAGSLSRLLALALVLPACGAVGFDVQQALPEQRVSGNPLGGVLPSFVPTPFSLTIDVKAETEKRGTGPATGASLKSLTLSATPAGAPSGTFDFLDEVHIFIQAAGLPKVEIATAKPIAKGLTTLDFTIVPKVELLPYINAGATLDASASGRQPSADFTFVGQVVVSVRI